MSHHKVARPMMNRDHYLTVIGVHSTMHLMRPNYCQITIMHVCVCVCVCMACRVIALNEHQSDVEQVVHEHCQGELIKSRMLALGPYNN